MRITQVSSGLITTHALTSASADACALATLAPALRPRGRRTPSARPPPAAATEPTMNARRGSMGPPPLAVSTSGSLLAGRHVHGGADALIGPAAADIGHRGVDVRVGGVRSLPQQGGRRHDLPGLAVAA